ncbi:MAG: phosphate ABC transporter permease PstA [Candidatus Methanomethylophilaceae archaeon]
MTNTRDGFATKKRFNTDVISRYALMAVASLTVLILFFIILFIVYNSTDAIADVGLWEFLTGTVWKPSADAYGAVPVIVGTILVTAGSVAIAVPIGVGAAIYISEVSSERARRILKPAVELFAGIPSVVYGFFGLVVMIPFLSGIFSEQMPTGFAWITGSLLLGIMALPTIISVSEDSLKAVPRSYREASLAMGATKWETTKKIVVPAAVSGISAAVILGIGRAIGETMAVMMVTGNAAIIPEPLWNIFSYIRTITASLALEMPEVVVGSTHYSALFVLALFLMIMVLAINLIAGYVVKRTKMKFEGNVSEGRFSDLLKKEKIRDIKTAAGLAIIFLIVLLAATLFVDLTMSAVIALAAVIMYKVLAAGLSKLSRKTIEKLAHLSLLAIILLVIGMLVVIIGDIVINALPSLNLEFITEYPKNMGTEGGIFPAIVGTLELVAGTALIALPIGIFSGAYLAEYAVSGKTTSLIRHAIDVLNGTPSIVFGLFGMTALVIFFGFGYSLIAGCISLALMIMPVIIRTTEEAVRSVPHELREASRAMGANKWQTTVKIVLPAAFGGIMTGSILGLGRAAGETAPIMFTAVVLMQSSLSDSIFDPVMALPYHLYYLATEGTADPSMQYATALVLLVIVLSMFILASVIRERSNKKNKW